MESTTIQDAHVPPPMTRQPVDSYHRHIRKTNGVDDPPEPEPEPGLSSAPARSGSQRNTAVSPDPVRSSLYESIASFFDPEILASSSAQPRRSRFLSSNGSGVRWPFLGSIRSRASRSLPPSPPADSTRGSTEIPLPWRPLFLHRRILIVFAIVFAALIAGLETSLQISNQNDGLQDSDDVSRYLWQYGTTLVFIIVAAFWTRVELQASAAMPWIRMLNNQVQVDKSLLVDYVSVFEPRALVKAIGNKDWLVAGPIIVALLFKVIIIFSTAFITPRVLTFANHHSSITSQATFANSASGLQNVGSLPYFTMAAMQMNNISYPNGVSGRAAYLPFESEKNEFLDISASVDGFIGGIDCEEAEVTLDELRLDGQGSVQLNLTISQNDCTSKQTITSTRFTSTEKEDLPRTFLAFQSGNCSDSTELDQQRIVVIRGDIDLDIDELKKQTKATNKRIEGKVSDSAAFLCKPNYAITTIQVSKTPEQVLSVTAVQDATNTTLDKVHPWTIAQALFDTFKTDAAGEAELFAFVSKNYDSDAIVNADEAISAALAMRQKEEGGLPKLDSLTDGNTLKKLAEDFYAQYSALIARDALMEPTSSSSTAIATYVERRLVVRPVPAHLMAALMAICFLLVLVIMLLAPRKGFLPRDVSTLIGMASVVAHSHPLVECLRGMGAANKESIQSRLKGSSYSTGAEGHEKLEDPNMGYYHIFGGKAPPQNVLPRRFNSSKWRQPIPLHGLIRLLYVVIVASIIIAFEVSLRVSQRHNGLRTVESDTSYMAWTVVPALVLLVVAMYMATLEWWTRLLAPFSHLSREGDFGETVGLNLADATRPVAWARAWKIGDVAALTAIAGGIIALLVVVASAPLFEPISLDRNSSISIRAEDFFANNLASSPDDPICTDCTNDTIMASLILAGNAPYPAFTFADLNLQSVSLGEDDDSDDLKITARLTAIRPNMTCRLYLVDEISTNITLGYTLDDEIANPLRIDLDGETCRGDGERDSSNAIIGTTRSALMPQTGSNNNSSNMLFGLGLGKTNTSSQCSDWLYVWGRLDDMGTDDVSVSSISALACNETIEAVDADVVLHGPGLHLYPVDRPRPDEETVKNTTVATPQLDYSSLLNVSADGLFDPFFAILNASWLAVPDSVFAGSSATDAGKVQSAILQQHGIIRAQSLNFKSRRRLSSRGTFPVVDGQNILSGVETDAPISRAVPVFSGEKLSQRIRLEQDPVATRILQGLLGALLLLHVISWIFARRLRLPRPPTTIASVTALLVDGNILKLLPRDAQWKTSKELEAMFEERDAAQRFYMGWEDARRRSRRDGRKKKKREGGAFGIRAVVSEEHMPEDLEMCPVPPRHDQPRNVESRPVKRVGTVRRGTPIIGAGSTLRKSVLVGKDNVSISGSQEPPVPSKRKRSITMWSGPKEMAKVWWASG
ncbi:hypothetical protein FZEAL_1880 [Fusarium zealandicum]|uniref:Uncharacterized protein n=1 Tax=Fusarium zealandicum TaxID=1053134 RepID=A0A8H4XPG5_9HYPO|nr:hypothetical protein FZEAL_1880 [Fusarium zealandicum]